MGVKVELQTCHKLGCKYLSIFEIKKRLNHEIQVNILALLKDESTEDKPGNHLFFIFNINESFQLIHALNYECGC